MAGIRLEVPERLMGDFKACEQYGHAMKLKHGKGFKRHTKLDDANMCLYLDMYLPKSEIWARVDMDIVRKDNRGRLQRRQKVNPEDLQTTGEEQEHK